MRPIDFILPEQSTVFREAGLTNPNAADVVRFLVLSAIYLNLPLAGMKELPIKQKGNPTKE